MCIYRIPTCELKPMADSVHWRSSCLNESSQLSASLRGLDIRSQTHTLRSRELGCRLVSTVRATVGSGFKKSNRKTVRLVTPTTSFRRDTRQLSARVEYPVVIVPENERRALAVCGRTERVELGKSRRNTFALRYKEKLGRGLLVHTVQIK